MLLPELLLQQLYTKRLALVLRSQVGKLGLENLAALFIALDLEMVLKNGLGKFVGGVLEVGVLAE